jgi:DNA-binding NarL/FixJ family response regulator
MVIDADPMFRFDLVNRFNQTPRFQVILEAGSLVEAQQALTALTLPQSEEQPFATLPLDLVVLSLDSSHSRTSSQAYLDFSQQLRLRQPTLPILLVATNVTSEFLAAAFQLGIAGFCPKQAGINEVVVAARQVAMGQPYWMTGMQAMAQSLTNAPLRQSDGMLLGWAQTVGRRVGRSGLQQIDAEIVAVSQLLADSRITLSDRWWLQGRRRELKAARWVVRRLLPTSIEEFDGWSQPLPSGQAELGRSTKQTFSTPSQSPQTLVGETSQRGGSHRPLQEVVLPSSLTAVELTPASLAASSSAMVPPSALMGAWDLQTLLFNSVTTKLQQSALGNLTEQPMEIDILRDDKKRELLYLILRQLEESLRELRHSQVTLEKLFDRQIVIMQNLWRAVVNDFFGKYYTIPISESLPAQFQTVEQIGLVDVLLQDLDIVDEAILQKIPHTFDLLAHLLFQTPLVIDNMPYVAGSVEAIARMEILLQNLMIQVANAVIQPLLNRFGDVVAIKQLFYTQQLSPSREIERFRNNLAWKYRLKKYVRDPVAVFESRHDLLTMRSSGIAKASVYAPRNQELDELSGIPLAVTLVLEARDAVAPRLQSAVSFVGRSLVYVLTEVIGRGIGLIGRGVIKGVGNVLQDTKFNRNSERP